MKKGTPGKVKEYLIDKMKTAYNTKEYKDFAELNLVNIRPGYLDAQGFYGQWESEYKKFDEVAKKVGLKK